MSDACSKWKVLGLHFILLKPSEDVFKMEGFKENNPDKACYYQK